MFYTYILQSQTTGNLYIGQTQDLEKRLLRHNSGGSTYTKNKGPWIILFSITFATRSETFHLEQKLKSWKNATKVKEWISQQKEALLGRDIPT